MPLFRSHASEFERARRTFEARRDELLAGHRGQWVAIRGEAILAIDADREALYPALHAAHPDLFPGDYDHFEIVDAATEAAGFRTAPDDTWSLLAEPWLDTDMPQDRWRARRILHARGFTGWRLAAYQAAAAAGFAWNGLRGEWMALDYEDAVLGWGWTASALIALAIGLATTKGVGIAVFLAAFFAWRLVFALWLRQQAARNPAR
jgi:hypothetical protein